MICATSAKKWTETIGRLTDRWTAANNMPPFFKGGHNNKMLWSLMIHVDYEGSVSRVNANYVFCQQIYVSTLIHIPHESPIKELHCLNECSQVFSECDKPNLYQVSKTCWIHRLIITTILRQSLHLLYSQQETRRIKVYIFWGRLKNQNMLWIKRILRTCWT